MKKLLSFICLTLLLSSCFGKKEDVTSDPVTPPPAENIEVPNEADTSNKEVSGTGDTDEETGTGDLDATEKGDDSEDAEKDSTADDSEKTDTDKKDTNDEKVDEEVVDEFEEELNELFDLLESNE